jgi:hypothetical protein
MNKPSNTPPEPSSHRIEPGQQYETCAPIYWLQAPDGTRGPVHTRIRILSKPFPGVTDRPFVTIATLTATGRETRKRTIATGSLHPDGTTRNGRQRTTGYRLVQHADGTPAAPGGAR